MPESSILNHCARCRIMPCMKITSAFEEILHSPRLPEYAAIIERKLADEQLRRRRFYAEMTDEVKAEFIDGEVILHSPARNWHLNASRNLITLLHVISPACGGLVHVEKALCIFRRNDYEPDIVFFGSEKAAQIRPDTLKFPVPDFIVEILSETTEARDRGVKFEDYAAHGVREYWIVDPQDETVEQYLLTDDGEYRLKLKSGSGDICSVVIPGFAIPVRAVFDPEANRLALVRLLDSASRGQAT